jgi:hypothetical protein
LQKYLLASLKSEQKVKHHNMSVNSNSTASQHFSHLSLVVLTPVIDLYFRIFPRIFVKIWKGPIRRIQWFFDWPSQQNSVAFFSDFW